MEKEMIVVNNQNMEIEAAAHHVIRVVDADADTDADSDWLNLMKEKRKQKPRLLNESAGNSSCCIFRAPQSVFKIKEKAYHPHIVSIGPFHHGKEHLKMIQEHKWRFLDALISRTEKRGVGIDHYFKAVAPMEERIRDCYAETIDLNSSEFIEMMVLDGCFIIELFCRVNNEVPSEPNDPIFTMSWVFPFLMRDLLRLENQIPFFVLQTLFSLAITSSDDQEDGCDHTSTNTLAKLALLSFDNLAGRPPGILEKYYSVEGKHLLDLFYRSYIPSSEDHGKSSDDHPVPGSIPSAKKLHFAGIEFKLRDDSKGSFLEIKFENGVLEIPLISIDDFTASFFLNCLAFEQCYVNCPKYITSYATFMNCLINTPNDVGFLCDKNIMENDFGTNKEVVRFFSNISKDLPFDCQNSYLSKLFVDVNEHCGNTWHVQWAEFKHTYFDNPWSFISLLAATMLLLLATIQAFFSIYGYVRPPSPPT